MGTCYRITIPAWIPPTVNELLRGTRRDRIRLAKEARQLVGGYALQAQVPPASCKRRVRLVIILPRGRRFPDVDAPFKSTLDALVACGVLRNDSHVWAELAPVRYVRGT